MEQSKKDFMLYIGSCRYMKKYDWSYFPGRLHTTKEIIYFLENIENIETIIEKNPIDLTNLIFGDIYHRRIKEKSIDFFNNNKKIQPYNKLIVEICSRKIYYYNNIPLNFHYTSIQNSNIIKKYNLKEKELSDKEIKNDLKYIIKLSQKKFNPFIQIHIIPHLNLKLQSNNEYIQKRKKLVDLLEHLCIKLNLKFHNIGKYIEYDLTKKAVLENYMKDGTHYSFGYEEIKSFLIKNIY